MVHCCGICGLMNRQPTVESAIGWGLAAPRVARLQHDVWRTRHAFHAAGDEGVAFAGLDRLGCTRNSLQARPAQTVDGLARNINREASEQDGHPCDVPVVLARLIRAPQNDIVEPRRVELNPLDGASEGHSSEIVGADGGEGTARASDRCSDRRNNERVTHTRNGGSAQPRQGSAKTYTAL